MKAILLSTLAAVYLFGATEQSGAIVNEVAKLRQKYEECRAGQSTVLGIEPKVYAQSEKERKELNTKVIGYKSRIADLEGQIKQSYSELTRLKKRNTEVEREISQKRGVVQSLEQTLTARDKNYRAEVERNEMLTEQTNTAKVSRIERKNLTDSLSRAKFDIERLENVIAKTAKERTRLEKELTESRAQVDKFRNTKTSSVANVQEVKNVAPVSDQSGKIKALQNELSRANALIVELQNTPKPSTKEKVVTKVVEPTDKIVALQRELSAAQTTIANLKKGSKVTVQERIVEKVLYRDRPVVQEKVIEKVVYKDRPIVQEKIVEKVVYKDRPVVHEKIVTKESDATEKLNRALQQKLAENEAQMEKLKAKKGKLTPPKMSKIAQTPDIKTSVVSAASTPKKGGFSSAYRMASNAPIYNAPGGSQVDTWEARRSFTAGNPSNGWVHITGYFVNRVWTPTGAGENLYVRESDVIRR
ncbi:hypothetical protein [Sulfuricurvum sp. RIFCSPLOWO2_12_FULL_43_24]|uniref:hypothetical protein n=1 Tax=Sulfuricurvum sp. RIFCSPLOWO2_12_FULL_43_24 TaxID=1802247 RepID=UPI0008BAE2D6|nr:hypothetical protein [Sulfuricurvum sp. RIFCSPLOWO2_12_FULL_43_24]OHD88376.1 MAG: hypothetical protein A3G19_10790 [Sulfuricurvum sp. RIFCSPLOWO2_12_FULL_43_24]